MPVKNRFNNITSKEWLPFQKSWFVYTDQKDIYRKYLRFFVKTDLNEFAPTAFFHGSSDKEDQFREVAAEQGIAVVNLDELDGKTPLQFGLIDINEPDKEQLDKAILLELRQQVVSIAQKIEHQLIYRRFLAIFTNNYQRKNSYYPFAWDLSGEISKFLSLKDEKIACLKTATDKSITDYFEPASDFFYCLHFRKDENSGKDYGLYTNSDFYKNITQSKKSSFPKIDSWHIIRPPRRNKNEILHPAKFPEDIVDLFLEIYTKPGDNIFDPMSGTASAQLAALMKGRNGYGTELSEFFTEIANERLQKHKSESGTDAQYKILNIDARNIQTDDFPKIDYIITSPPYWDMLNMAGAENQAKRKEKGLKTNYSDNDADLGNISDYRIFIEELVSIYKDVLKLIKPGGYFTIIVKNIKKKGKNYPFAYDLGHLLQDELILMPEIFWLQDDINIAPYGYGNTFVSNTFHQYCLTFQKPF